MKRAGFSASSWVSRASRKRTGGSYAKANSPSTAPKRSCGPSAPQAIAVAGGFIVGTPEQDATAVRAAFHQALSSMWTTPSCGASLPTRARKMREDCRRAAAGECRRLPRLQRVHLQRAHSPSLPSATGAPHRDRRTQALFPPAFLFTRSPLGAPPRQRMGLSRVFAGISDPCLRQPALRLPA